MKKNILILLALLLSGFLFFTLRKNSAKLHKQEEYANYLELENSRLLHALEQAESKLLDSLIYSENRQDSLNRLLLYSSSNISQLRNQMSQQGLTKSILLDSISQLHSHFTTVESKFQKSRIDFLDSIHTLTVQIELLGKKIDEQKTLKFKSPGGTQITYFGTTKDEKAHGNGIGLYANGNSYEGEWLEGQKHGKGVYKWADGERYEGDFILNKRTGFGIYYWSSGESYHGYWENDKQHGEGVILDKSGKEKQKGLWKNGRFSEQLDTLPLMNNEGTIPLDR
jgi:hypothetical protein